MRAVLDTCVLYPTVMREMLLGAAEAGFFTPFWSRRILEEWAHAARKIGPTGQVQARAEIAVISARCPGAEIEPRQGDLARLWLPDANDVHVLAAAIACSADMIVTLNRKDFPRNILTEEGLARADPDSLLTGFYAADPVTMAGLAERVRRTAEELSGRSWPMRALMKKARLPRLARALAQH
ncbi:MAG: RSP_2648 family PIN domain-containing protein [Halocynthiibacter sp.]